MVGPCEGRLHSAILFVELIGIFNAVVVCTAGKSIDLNHVFDKCLLSLRHKHLCNVTSVKVKRIVVYDIK